MNLYWALKGVVMIGKISLTIVILIGLILVSRSAYYDWAEVETPWEKEERKAKKKAEREAKKIRRRISR
ncbi:MAG: hypothetical protein IJX75_04790 [Clostridia bacterium]|nr:hypothetical protein [Clostridia bacterium]